MPLYSHTCVRVRACVVFVRQTELRIRAGPKSEIGLAACRIFRFLQG